MTSDKKGTRWQQEMRNTWQSLPENVLQRTLIGLLEVMGFTLRYLYSVIVFSNVLYTFSQINHLRNAPASDWTENICCTPKQTVVCIIAYYVIKLKLHPSSFISLSYRGHVKDKAKIEIIYIGFTFNFIFTCFN